MGPSRAGCRSSVSLHNSRGALNAQLPEELQRAGRRPEPAHQRPIVHPVAEPLPHEHHGLRRALCALNCSYSDSDNSISFPAGSPPTAFRPPRPPAPASPEACGSGPGRSSPSRSTTCSWTWCRRSRGSAILPSSSAASWCWFPCPCPSRPNRSLRPNRS